ncbi:MAG TPA: VOC family protein [Solirubrobacterales bacterium]|nr:VOC family protein [Solirubrobacterales bacterium]
MKPKVVPELDVADLPRALRFYTVVCGFRIVYERPEDAFVYLEREGAELMLEDAAGPGRRFRTAPLTHPFGRGVNLQIEVSDAGALHDSVVERGVEPLVGLEHRRYRIGDEEITSEQFVIADEDGYLLRFFTDRGASATPSPT